jgi:putative phosphoribosyl transferase
LTNELQCIYLYKFSQIFGDSMIFKNRHDAAQQLIIALSSLRDEDLVVMAIPRGGVPIASEIAEHFGWPLDLIFTKKIGHPANPELAIGSISLTNEIIDDRFSVAPDWLKEEIKRVRSKLRTKYEILMKDRKPADVDGKKVLIVDDGIATGNTVAVAIEVMRQLHAKEIIVAVPVASVEAARCIKSKADKFICIHTPHNFMAVGQYYSEFPQVSDEEVLALMRMV